MEGWAAVTHSEWFAFLARQAVREEVNFWSPSDYYASHGMRQHTELWQTLHAPQESDRMRAVTA